MASSSLEKFRIVIVGGGIAGLATAITMRRPGREVIILEQSRMAKEIGALISLQPNASKIATAFGLDAYLAPKGPVTDKALRIYDIEGTVTAEIKLEKELYGGHRKCYHRQDLHEALRTCAMACNEAGGTVELRTSSRVIACDCEEGIVKLESGDIIQADLIVGADGIHSVLREKVLKRQHDAMPTGISAYRMLVPSATIEQLDNLAIDPREPVTHMLLGHDRRVIMGPARDGNVFGIVALVPDVHMTENSNATRSWTSEGSLPKLLDIFREFPQWLRDIFAAAAADGLALWQLRDIDPISTWVRGRTILIGDAAHAMLPTQGQGASQSFEDAEALGAIFSDVDSRPSLSDVNGRLQSIFDVRYERATLIQSYSRQQAKPATKKGEKGVTLNPVEFQKYNCNYEGARDWQKRQQGGGGIKSS